MASSFGSAGVTATGPKERLHADNAGAALDLAVEALERVRNRYEMGGADVRPRRLGRGLWCDHPGQRHREHEDAGRPVHTMSCELALVAGRLCDSPGCAESADP